MVSTSQYVHQLVSWVVGKLDGVIVSWLLYPVFCYLHLYIVMYVYISIQIFFYLLQNDLQNVVVDMQTNVVVIVAELPSLKQSMNYNCIILNLFILRYIILLYYIMLYYIFHLTFILLLIYNLFKGSNSNVKQKSSKLRQRDNVEKDL